MSRHLLVIGGQRCGTTTLHGLLDAHPEIAMARPVRPEPKVFCSDGATERGVDWYRATYFAHATEGQLLGDKSTSYIEDPRAPERAGRMLGTPTILALLRDPIDRAVSNWRFSTDNGFESRPLEVALRENLTRSVAWDPSATSVSPFAYLERGRYADYLTPWLDRFPRTSQVSFLDDLVAGTDGIARLYAAIGVAPVDTGAVPRLNGSTSPAAQLPAELIGQLRDYYARSDADLARLVGRTPPWATSIRSTP
ncbi:MAG TPA: sulfotransferase domain-containing protein [Marmoricola sp.]